MKLGIFGAGAIGASLGVRLSAVGMPVAMVGRPALVRVQDALVSYDRDGTSFRPGDDLEVDTDPSVLRDVDLCLVTVKSRHTEAAAAALRGVLPPQTWVISLQNGLQNPRRLRRALRQPVAAAVVGFNAVRSEPAVFRQTAKGPLVVASLPGRSQRLLDSLGEALARAGVSLRVRDDIGDVMAGKLLLSLNNGICAVTGCGLQDSVAHKPLRLCFAQLIREGTRVLTANGLRPRAIAGIPPSAIARMLTLPDSLARHVTDTLVNIDPAVKSSMLSDLEAGKPTEIDDLSGEIVAKAELVSLAAPANALIVHAVHALEGQATPRFWTPAQLEARIRAAV